MLHFAMVWRKLSPTARQGRAGQDGDADACVPTQPGTQNPVLCSTTAHPPAGTAALHASGRGWDGGNSPGGFCASLSASQ